MSNTSQYLRVLYLSGTEGCEIVMCAEGSRFHNAFKNKQMKIIGKFIPHSNNEE